MEISKKVLADQALLVTTAIYLLINGAGIWEEANIIPLWTAAPPASLHIFQGDYGLRYKNFWIIAHSVHEIFFILAIVLNWNVSGRRNPLLIIFGVHAAVRVWTILYFAPVLMEFWEYPIGDTIDPLLKTKADAWAFRSHIRSAAFLLLSFAMIPLNKSYFIKTIKA
ncbi:transposase [Fulvivirgaceae bacterium PWU4]|uniref:Transposase n=1 Tax=Chryseosolibacter histidini TaxID=2782349 RepID=A0AAP2DKU0_9BACT|nr:transposase [Chryseosolibacter histidini]MBT1696807.1 transposase [Chryseosolibacter histidini]